MDENLYTLYMDAILQTLYYWKNRGGFAKSGPQSRMALGVQNGAVGKPPSRKRDWNIIAFRIELYPYVGKPPSRKRDWNIVHLVKPLDFLKSENLLPGNGIEIMPVHTNISFLNCRKTSFPETGLKSIVDKVCKLFLMSENLLPGNGIEMTSKIALNSFELVGKPPSRKRDWNSN